MPHNFLHSSTMFSFLLIVLDCYCSPELLNRLPSTPYLLYFYGDRSLRSYVESRIHLHKTRSWAAPLQSPLTPAALASSSTAHIQRVQGLPRSRRPLSGSLINIIFAGRSSAIRVTWPAHCNLPCFISLTISASSYT